MGNRNCFLCGSLLNEQLMWIIYTIEFQNVVNIAHEKQNGTIN